MIKIHINEDFCKGCGYCIEFCPTKVFDRSTKLNLRGIYPPVPERIERCTACRICEYYCPDLALFIED